MTLEEAIKHCEEVAEENTKACDRCVCFQNEYNNIECDECYIEVCNKCASEHRQLAEWLKALKEIWDSGDCNDCRNGQCEWKPKLGQLVRYNCPHYVGIANEEVNADDE